MPRCCRNEDHWESRELRQSLIMEYSRCSICWIDAAEAERTQFTGLQMMHIFGGSSRHHVRENVMLGCHDCHEHQTRGSNPDMPEINLGVLLAVKRDMGEFSAAALAEISIYQAAYIEELAATPIPQGMLDRRIKHEPRSFLRA